MSGDAVHNIDPSLQYQQPYPARPQPPTTASSGDQLPYFLAAAHDAKTSPIDPNLQQLEAAAAAATASADQEHNHDEDEEEHDGENGSAGAQQGGDSAKRARACDNCRSLKVRCELPDDPADPLCKRCRRTKKHCITTPPTKKRQKKDVSLITQLKQQVDELSAVVRAQAAQQATHTPQETNYSGFPTPAFGSTSSFPGLSYNGGQTQSTNSPGQPNYPTPSSRTWSERENQGSPPSESNKKRRIDSNASHEIPMPRSSPRLPAAGGPPAGGPPHTVTFDHSDIIKSLDRVLGREMAGVVFERYKTDVCEHFPAVPIPPGMTADTMREKKPILFLAIITAASFMFPKKALNPTIQSELTQLLKDQFADIVWRNAEKSLEIVQALQISVLWYRPPPHFEQHAFYLMANTATIMSLDLGLGKRVTTAYQKMNIGPFRKSLVDATSIEARRALLVCYYLTLSITMVMRRPILLRWSKFMDESLEMFETSTEASPSDRLLCYHVKLMKLAEDIATQFAMDDPTAAVTMADTKAVYAVNGFKRQLNELKTQRIKSDIPDAFVKMSENVLNLYIHEVALHTTQNTDDFRPPFMGDHMSRPQEQHEIFGHTHVEALGQCLSACHGILDSFINMPFSQRCTMPVLFCVRIVYSSVCLMKMWVAINGPGNIKDVINEKDLKVDDYLDRVVSTFETFVTNEGQAPHGKFFFIAKRLRNKFKQIKDGGGRNADGSINFGCPGEERPSSAPQQDPPTSTTVNQTQQTPLHMLSDVAMANSSQQHQQTTQGQLQRPQMPGQQGWYNQAYTDFQEINFDPNLDLGMIDFNNLNMMNTDFSGLIASDGVWTYPTNFEVGQQQLNGFPS